MGYLKPEVRKDSRLGQVVGGYRLIEVLAKGSTSTVFRAEHIHLGRSAAVKVLSENLAQDDLLKARTLKEAKVVNDIGHPNIGDIFDFVDEPPRLALVMEHVAGPSMLQLRGESLPVSMAMELSLQVISAIQAAHEHGVVHRDLKASNILFTAHPLTSADEVQVKVVDFGIAKVLGPDQDHLTASGAMLGTPAYMAPEQASGRIVSFATDVYAVAELIYELFTGSRLFPVQAPAVTLREKMDGTIPPLRLLPATKSLEPWLLRALSADPEQRPSLEELRAAISYLEFIDDGITESSTGGGVPATLVDTGPPTQALLDRPPQVFAADITEHPNPWLSPRRTETAPSDDESSEDDLTEFAVKFGPETQPEGPNEYLHDPETITPDPALPAHALDTVRPETGEAAEQPVPAPAESRTRPESKWGASSIVDGDPPPDTAATQTGVAEPSTTRRDPLAANPMLQIGRTNTSSFPTPKLPEPEPRTPQQNLRSSLIVLLVALTAVSLAYWAFGR